MSSTTSALRRRRTPRSALVIVPFVAAFVALAASGGAKRAASRTPAVARVRPSLPAQLQGAVRWEDGTPARNVRVVAASGTARKRFISRTTTTDANGRFELDALPPGELIVAGIVEGEPVTFSSFPRPSQLHLSLTAGQRIANTMMTIKNKPKDAL